VDGEAGGEGDPAGVDEHPQPGAQRPAGGQGVVGAAAVGPVRVGGPHGPGDPGTRCLLGQLGEGGQGGRGGVPGTDHDGVPPGVAVPVGAEHVGQRAVDPRRRVGLAVRR
jgi:hypothetical protein